MRRSDFFAVPHVARAAFDRFRRVRNDDLVSGLYGAPRRGVQLPTETRRLGFDADRVGLLLAFEFVYAEGLSLCCARSEQQQYA